MSAQSDADEAAEKFVGIFGNNCLDYKEQVGCLGQILSNLPESEEDPVSISLALEEKFLNFSKDFYAGFKKDHPKEMSLGIDDLIMEIASHREQACFHLRRTLIK